MRDMSGSVALVTGGGSGIGQSVALRFATRGAKVVVADISHDGGQRTVAMIRDAGGEGIFVPCDVTVPDQVADMVRQAVGHFGRLDYALNNAGGTSEFAMLADTSEDYWHRCIAVHLTGVWLCMKAEIGHMLGQGGGAIVNTASVAGLMGSKGVCAYAAAKHGVIGLRRTAALEYATAGIRVNAVCPGAIFTPIVQAFEKINPAMTESLRNAHAMKRFGEPMEVAEAVVWLCSGAASFITGAALPVDGGVCAGLA